jgi:integrase
VKGTIELRRRFRGVTIRVASGTHSAKMAAKLDGMLLTLADSGRLDVLRAIQKRHLSPMEVWEHFRSGRLAELPSPAALKALKPTWEKWARTVRVSDSHRLDVAMYGKRFLAAGAVTVRDLPEAVKQYRETCAARGKAVSFNRARAAALAFLRDVLGRRDSLYADIQDVETLKPGARKVTGGQTPAKAIAIAQKLPADCGRDWLVMCLTGMGPKEYEGAWESEGEAGLRIHGTKRRDRDRLIPRVLATVPRPARSVYNLREHMREAHVGVTPYDGRRTFAHAMEEAGIPRARRKAYLGHAAGDSTDLYERHEVLGFLPEDRNRIQVYWGMVAGNLDELLNRKATPKDGPNA